MGGIGVISNPNSRMNRRRPVICEELKLVVGTDGIVRETSTLAEIDGVVREFCSRDIEILAVNGGDGTLHHTLSHLIPIYSAAGKPLPSIVMLCGGTMNTINRSFRGMRGSPGSILSRVVEKFRRKEKFKYVERHTLVVNGEEHCFIFGLGLAASFLKLYYEGRTTGPLKAVYVLARAVVSTLWWGAYAQRIFERVRARVIGDEVPSPYENYTVLIASTVSEIGLGFSPLGRTLSAPGKVQVIAAAVNPLGIVSQLQRIYFGTRIRGAVYDELVKSFTIDLKQDGYDFMLDGEVKPAPRHITVQVGPLVRFIRR